MSEKCDDHGPFLNTDRELWRERPGDYYANSIHVTEQGGIGINVGGMVFVKSLRHWHELAKDAAAAEERGRRKGVEERDELRRELWQAQAKIHDLEVCVERFRAFAPRDSMTAAENAIETKRKARQDEEAEAFKYAEAPRDSGKDLEWPEDGT